MWLIYSDPSIVTYGMCNGICSSYTHSVLVLVKNNLFNYGWRWYLCIFIHFLLRVRYITRSTCAATLIFGAKVFKSYTFPSDWPISLYFSSLFSNVKKIIKKITFAQIFTLICICIDDNCNELQTLSKICR